MLISALAAVVRSNLTAPAAQVGPVPKPPAMLALESLKLPGWMVETLPLGETELVRQKVLETLNFDQATFLRFRRGEREFSVYLAYWAPGKATARDVRLHTPDTCWVQSGWEEMARNEACYVPVEAGKSEAGQYRRYSQHGFIQHVVFWHFMNGRLVPHWRYGQPTPRQVMEALWGKTKEVLGEQYFLRISSAEPLDWLWQDPAGVALLRILAPVGMVPAEG